MGDGCGAEEHFSRDCYGRPCLFCRHADGRSEGIHAFGSVLAGKKGQQSDAEDPVGVVRSFWAIKGGAHSTAPPKRGQAKFSKVQ